MSQACAPPPTRTPPPSLTPPLHPNLTHPTPPPTCPAQIADLTISLEGSGPDGDLGAPAMVVAYRLLSAINQRVKDDAGAR